MAPDDRHVLSLSTHHTVSDGGSLGLLAEEIGALYRGAPLAPLPVQYADFALWQRRELSEGELAGQIAYWRRELAGAPTLLELPLDRPRPPEPSYRGWVVPFGWDGGLAADLERAAARFQATPYMVGLALAQAFLGRLAGQEELLVGSPLAHRRPETEGVVGYFVNTVVLRGRPRLDRTFAGLLEEAAAAARGAFAHPDLPVERLAGRGGRSGCSPTTRSSRRSSSGTRPPRCRRFRASPWPGRSCRSRCRRST